MELNTEELNSIRAAAAEMVKKHGGYESIIKAIDYIKSNKEYLAVADAIKIEHKANKIEIERMHDNIKKANFTLKGLASKATDLNIYLKDGYKQKIQDQEKELEKWGEKKRAEIEDDLGDVRQELKDTRLQVKRVKTELEDTTKTLKGVQTSIRDMFTK